MSKTVIDNYFKEIMSEISDGVYILDASLKINFMNSAARKIMGIAKEDVSIIGLTWNDFLKKTLGPYSGFAYTPIKKTERSTYYEVKLETKDGGCTYLKQQNKQVFDNEGRLLGVVAIMKDIVRMSRQENLPSTDRFHNIIGNHYKMMKMYDSIKQVAGTDATVLILGESGTGKELVADAIHNISKRKAGPFIKLNCNALSEHILESELFGHIKGAFTGAINDKVGKFELANKGTIFLDEIGDLSPHLQVKLLRVLQEREIERVGSNNVKKVDVRIITATNKDLRKAVGEGKFREDLYFRVKVFPIKIPPLRDRAEDIVLLSNAFVDNFVKIHRKQVHLSSEVLELFKRYSWPGNVRELQHAIEYACIKTKKKIISFDDVPEELFDNSETTVIHAGDQSQKTSYIDKNILRETLKAVNWNKTKAAQRLNISRTSIWRLIKKHNVMQPLLLPYDQLKSNLYPVLISKQNSAETKK